MVFASALALGRIAASASTGGAMRIPVSCRRSSGRRSRPRGTSVSPMIRSDGFRFGFGPGKNRCKRLNRRRDADTGELPAKLGEAIEAERHFGKPDDQIGWFSLRLWPWEESLQAPQPAARCGYR